MNLTVIAFAAVFALVMSVGLLVSYRHSLTKRLASLRPAGPAGSSDAFQRLLQLRSRTSVESIVTPFQKVLPRSTAEVSIVQKRLIRAGFRKDSHVNIFYGCKVLVPAILLILLVLTGAGRYGGFFAYAAALALGFLLPDFYLGNRIKARQLSIRLGLPDALDLMVICVEAGLGLDQVIQRTAEEMRMSNPEISDELTMVGLEQAAGRPRVEAWKNLAERTDVDAMRAVTATMIQADSFGIGISRALRTHSETLRTRRRQQVEEEAAKTSVKLVFPLVFFIFPSLFVVALGPSLIVMMEDFEKYLLQ
jgi:tight adherence protein C